MPRVLIMDRRWLFWEIFATILTTGISLQVDVSLDHRNTGYFLKPLFGAKHFNPGIEERHFVVTHPKGQAKITALYGPFGAEETISPQLLQETLGNHSRLLSNLVVDDMDVSAHLVARSITQERPTLQVLFHASQLEGDDQSRGSSSRDSGASHGAERKWCLQMHIQRDSEELTSVCVLSSRDNVCIAELTIPLTWWDEAHIHTSVDVLYSVYPIDQNLQCSSASNSIVPGKENSQGRERIKSYVGTVTLTHGQLTYQEVKEDQHVLLYIPQKSFYPGSKFHLPVKLQAESDLELFVVRVKARHGIKIIGAEANHPDKWRITVDLNQKRRGAMVTAFITDKDTYTKTDRVQDIFDWIFEVEDSSDEEDPGRIIVNLEYEMNSKQEESYGAVQNRVIARVHVQHDNIRTIVPVIKTTELINTAILTGRLQNFQMRIFSLTQTGKITDITAQTTCHSGDEDVLKVVESCNLVYLDGSETKGSPSVSVIAKYGRHTKFLFFKVWVPEFPLEIELSDNKLSQVKGWKAPKHQRSRKARGADEKGIDPSDILTHPGLLNKEDKASTYDYKIEDIIDDDDEDDDDGEETEEYMTSCHLRFQQSLVEVYAHFHIPDGNKNQYLVHRKALFRITDLVQDRLRVADLTIASLSGNVIEGLRPGRTEVQVMSQMGRVIGAREIKVGNNKVIIERLQVDVVTGINMVVDAEEEIPGTLVARILHKEQLQKKYEEAILDISILFSDGTTIPLRHIPPSDYFLDMDTLNNHVVAFGPMLSSDQPRIIALGQGKGELLKLSLELGDTCQKKKSRPLSVSYVYIDVDFSKPPEDETALQSDGNFGTENRASGRYETKDVKTDKGTLQMNVQQKQREAGQAVKPDNPNDPINIDQPLKNIPLDDDLAELVGNSKSEMSPSHEAQQQHVSEARGMTALEIGMYVLLGIFCLAIVVFMINCMVFVYRYRRKRIPYEVSESIQNANDWVWIGRATLERNSINTQCAATLMPEADFNGNQNNPNLLHPAVNATNGYNSMRNSDASSNRNSVVSTYKGSECSIRITSNPHPDANPAEKTESQKGSPGTPPNPPTATEGIQTAPDSPKNTLPKQEVQGPVPPPVPPHAPRPDAASNNANNVDGINNNVNAAVGPPPPVVPVAVAPMNSLAMPEVQWDYEAMGMTYEQLMEYFDNLKESTA